MSTAYNPKVPTEGLELYFDSKNPKSFQNGTLYSLTDENSIEVSASLSQGYLIPDIITETSTLNSIDIESYDNISFVFSLDNISENSIIKFSSYNARQTQNAYYPTIQGIANVGFATANVSENISYSNTLITLSNNTVFSFSAFANVADNILYSNTAKTLYANTANAGFATANVSDDIAYSNTAKALYANTANAGFATANVSDNILYSNTLITLSNNTVFSSNALYSTDFDSKLDYGIIFGLDQKNIFAYFINNINVQEYAISRIIDNNNSIFTVIFRKNSYSSAISIYQDELKIADSGINNSLLFKNSKLNLYITPSISFRTLSVYQKELSIEEIQTTYNALSVKGE